MGEGQWQAHQYDGYHPVAVDVTGFWRPRLHACPTTHYHGGAGKALPAVPLGLIARVGRVGTQRLALPLGLVRADAADPSPAAQTRALLTEAVARTDGDDVLVVDRGVGVAAVQVPETDPFPPRVRATAAVTAHLPTGCWGQRRPRTATDPDLAAMPDPQPSPQAA